MKKQIVADGIIYLICMAVAVLLNLLVSALVESIGATIGFTEYYHRAWIRMITGFFVGCAILSALVYRECYKSLAFYPAVLVPAIGLAGLCQMVLAIILNFHPVVSGGVRDLAGILSFGSGFDSVSMIEKLELPLCILAFLIYLVFEILTALAFGYLGVRRREKSRKELFSKETEQGNAD